MLSFGDPSPFTGRIKASGRKIICQVQTLAQAKEAAAAGADIIIAPRAGRRRPFGDDTGHNGAGTGGGRCRRTYSGGRCRRYRRRRGLAAALALGAAGISMGTRFTASRESLWDQAMKDTTLNAGGDQTEQTRVFDIVRGAAWPATYPGRALRNAFSGHWCGREDDLAADQLEQEKAYLATAPDNFATRVVWAGEGIDLVHDIPTASAIIERIIAQAVATLTEGAKLIRY